MEVITMESAAFKMLTEQIARRGHSTVAIWHKWHFERT